MQACQQMHTRPPEIPRVGAPQSAPSPPADRVLAMNARLGAVGPGDALAQNGKLPRETAHLLVVDLQGSAIGQHHNESVVLVPPRADMLVAEETA